MVIQSRMLKSPVTMPLRPRRNGWTPDVQQRFLEELAATGSPKLAAAAAGRSLQSAYKLRARPGAAVFRDRWATAITTCIMMVRETALDHALNGHVGPITRSGRKVGERKVSNDRMLLSMMRLYDAPAYHADRARAAMPVIAAEPAPPTDAELIAACDAALLDLLRVANAEVADIVRDALLQRVALESPCRDAARQHRPR